MIKSFFFCAAVCAAGVIFGAPFDEKSELLLYANLDDSAAPTLNAPGSALAKASGLQYAPGKFGQGVRFDKTTPGVELRYKLGKSLNSNDSWTLAMWLRPDGSSASDPANYSYFFRTDATGAWADGVLLGYFCRWNQLRLDRFGADRKSVSAQTASSAVPGEKWTHFALACEKGKITLYINGNPTKLSGKDLLENVGTPQQFLRIGAIDGTPATRFKGTIDEVKVFKRSLTPDEVRLVMESKPGSDSGKQPVLQVPFNGRFDCIGSAGPVQTSMENVAFRPAVIGKGAEFIRHGYDRAGRASVADAALVNGPSLSVSLFFVPKGFDDNKRGLVTSGKFWSLFRQGRKLTFEAGGQSICADISTWKAEQPVQITAGFSPEKMFIALDGKIVATGQGVKLNAPEKSTVIIGDLPGYDMYSTGQAHGTIDELRIFNTLLNDKEIATEIARKNDPDALGDPLDRWSIAAKPATAEERKLWSFDGAEQSTNPCRSEVTLNALWRFQLTAPGVTPDVSQWHYLALPGRYAGHGNGNSDHVFQLRDANFKRLNGEEFLWNGIPGYKLSESFWERKITLPGAWRDRRFELHFDDFSEETARLFVNGKFVAEFGGGRPHTIAVPAENFRFDQENDLQLIVTGASHRWAWRGIKGNLTLRAMPTLSIAEPFIIPSVADRTLTIKAKVRNFGTQSRSIRLAAAVEGKNAPAAFESKEMTLRPGEEREMSLSTPWNNAQEWTHLTPYLYRATLSAVDAKGKTIDQLAPIRFGFRDFKIEGKNYKLNGKTIHLFNTDEWVNFANDPAENRKFLQELKRRGYNSIRLSFSMKDDNLNSLLDIADEEGILLMVNARGIGGAEYSLWNSPEMRAKVADSMKASITEWRNHPSIVMWYLSVNFLGYSLDYHPRKMTDGYQPEQNRDKFRVSQEGEKILLANDSTRPFFYQAGGSHGPILNSNAYFCWWPQAERRSWAEEWRAIGDKPLHIIETSFPYVSSTTGMDRQFQGKSKVRLIHENAARYLGNDAYDASQKLVNDYVEGSREGKSFFGVTLASSHFRNFKTFGKVRNYLLLDTIPYWRASGISGICPFGEFVQGYQTLNARRQVNPGDFRRKGLHPDILKSKYQMEADFSKPNSFADALQRAFAPKLALIAGSETEPTSVASNYYVGLPIRRTLILLNDTLETSRFKGDVFFTSDRVKLLNRKPIDVTLQPGEIRRIPVEFTANVPGNWYLDAKFDQVHSEKVALQVMPKPTVKTAGRVALFDPQRHSAADLKQANIPFEDAEKLQSLQGVSLLFIGKNTLGSPALEAWAEKVALPKAKLNIVILEQDAKRLATVGLKSAPIDARDVFKVNPTAFPASLSDRQLSNWHGISTLAADKPEPSPEDYISIPEQLWRWNTINTVVSTPIRRTGAGRTTSLLSCGMDLAYSALLEIPSKNGSVVFCQMELSGRSNREPAAAQLLAELANRYSRSKFPAMPQAEYLGRLTPEQCRKFGLSVKRGRASEFKITEAGQELLGDLSRRDCFFSTPMDFDAYNGSGVTALTDPACVVRFERDGKQYLAAGFDATHLQKRLAETREISPAISDYWAQYVMKERLDLFESRLAGRLSPNLAEEIAQPRRADDVLSLDGKWSFLTDPKNAGQKNNWQGHTPAGTKELQVPGFWENQGFPKYDGVAWYFKSVKLPENLRGRELFFVAKAIDDLDEVYCNAVKIGSTGEEVDGYWTALRRYRIPAEQTRQGVLNFAVRVTDLRGNGGIPGNVALVGVNSHGEVNRAFPYREEDFPKYNTESAIRW